MCTALLRQVSGSLVQVHCGSGNREWLSGLTPARGERRLRRRSGSAQGDSYPPALQVVNELYLRLRERPNSA